MNILITSVGRRNYIVEYFNDSLKGRGRVVTMNSEPFTSGTLASAINYVAPPIQSDSYIPFVLSVCESENIDLVLSLFDQDLLKLAAAREEFVRRGTKLAISDIEVIKLTFDKLKLSSFLESAGISGPKTNTRSSSEKGFDSPGSRDFPFMLKPRWGTGSIATMKVVNQREYTFFIQYLSARLEESYINIAAGSNEKNEMLIQAYIEGEEYHLDVLNDLDGNFVAVFPKKKLSMRSGETDAAVTIDDVDLKAIGADLSAQLKHVGVLDVDIIKDREGRYHVIDCNPRFGGGYPFAHAAGANIPGCYVNWMQNLPVRKEWLTARNQVIGVKGFTLFAKQLNAQRLEAFNDY